MALGLRADRVAGHSFGEFPALAAAGAWSFAAAVRFVRARCAAIDANPLARGTMLAANVPAAVLERLCGEVGGRVYVANHNAPEQTVASGDHESIARLSARLEQEGYQVRRWPSLVPFIRR